MELSFIVNATETKVLAKKTDTVETMAQKALDQTKNSLRPDKPLSEWLVICKDTTLDTKLPLNKQWFRDSKMKIVPLKIKSADIIFMTIKAGIGA